MKETTNPQCLTLSVEDVATILGISRSSCYALAKKAVDTNEPFRAVRLGGSIRVSRKSFNHYLEANEI